MFSPIKTPRSLPRSGGPDGLRMRIDTWLPNLSAKAKIGVLGASGYTGSELVRLLLRHPNVELALLTADRRAGQEMRAVFPQFSPFKLPTLVSIDERRLEEGGARSGVLRAAACHHAEGGERSSGQGAEDQGGRSSADFRLHDEAAYAKWYGHEHHAPKLQKEAVYGLVEVHRDDDQEGAACRQPRLLHELRAACADAAAQGQGDRAGRDRDRRQVRHDRGGQGGQGGDAVLRGVGGLPRLWRRPSPAHGRARPGVLARRRPRGGGDASRRIWCR